MTMDEISRRRGRRPREFIDLRVDPLIGNSGEKWNLVTGQHDFLLFLSVIVCDLLLPTIDVGLEGWKVSTLYDFHSI